MTLKTESDLNAACEALKQWFISQDLKPHEGICVVEHFVALMMIDNAKNGGTPIETKMQCFIEGIMLAIARDLTR